MASGGGELEHEADEDLLPQPIYMRLGSRLLQYRESYYDVEDDDSGDEEVSDAQVGLDLTAPPPDSWYHGRISRLTACERLEMVGELGAYLVRESVGQPGDYAISYLSKTGHVHHFKINSNCGDFYIGGRQFFSLGDLIGFYANCSCILENESLEVPVVPPKPMPLYMTLRATAPHTKTAGTDELSIVPGEVFMLLSRLNDDWGWGRSQRTGESGLIPIVIMEDVTDSDPNLGKPWYHGNIDRDKAVELLQRQGDIGSFLVRLSRPRGDHDGETKYSLAVRTPERVQRFLITKFDTGYYMFGGRPFNSIEDIIDRYRNEVILDGLKLGTPVAKDPVPLLHLHPSLETSHPMRDRSKSTSISRADMPGDKTGRLLLRKGKKSPVYGKWKEFYFVAKFREQKLLYYDHENSHRAKGLLDLRQCKVYAVHPSLYGRSDVFVVMLRYLNELAFYYIAAENAQDWLRLLQQCTAADLEHQEQLLEVQQIRSLSLSVRDCKLAKGGARMGANPISCLVSIDGACIARSRVATEVPCVFDENFHFEYVVENS